MMNNRHQLSGAIQTARRNFSGYRNSGLEMTPEDVTSLCDAFQVWEAEAKNMEGRLAHVNGEHKALDGLAMRLPSEIQRRYRSADDSDGGAA